MVVDANSFFFVGAANHAENDTGAQGGQIDKGVLVVMFGLGMTTPDQLAMESNVAITATYTITGRDGGGGIISEEFSFSNETGPIVGGLTFHRILKIVKTFDSPTQVGSNAVIGFHEYSSGLNKGYLYGSGRSPSGAEITEVRRFFIGATRPGVASPPVATDYYEKFFILNAHATAALSSGEVRKTSDPGAMISFAVADSIDDTGQSTNRLTAPTGVSTFDSQDKTIPDAASPITGSLAAGEAIGVWLRLRIYSYHSAGTGTCNVQIRGEGL